MNDILKAKRKWTKRGKKEKARYKKFNLDEKRKCKFTGNWTADNVIKFVSIANDSFFSIIRIHTDGLENGDVEQSETAFKKRRMICKQKMCTYERYIQNS